MTEYCGYISSKRIIRSAPAPPSLRLWLRRWLHSGEATPLRGAYWLRSAQRIRTPPFVPFGLLRDRAEVWESTSPGAPLHSASRSSLRSSISPLRRRGAPSGDTLLCASDRLRQVRRGHFRPSWVSCRFAPALSFRFAQLRPPRSGPRSAFPKPRASQYLPRYKRVRLPPTPAFPKGKERDSKAQPLAIHPFQVQSLSFFLIFAYFVCLPNVHKMYLLYN